MEILHTTGIHKQVGEPKKVRKKVQPSGNRKDLKCVRRRRRRRRRLCQLIPMCSTSRSRFTQS